MADLKKTIDECVGFIRKQTQMIPEVGIILGTGLGQLAQEIKIDHSIPYDKIPDFPVSTVESHQGRLIFGTLSGRKVVAMQGRFHYYEGYSAHQITLPVRVMKYLGIKLMIVSNACGGLNPLFSSGDLVIITDHINLLPENPLRGPNDESIGPRFPDMYNTYDKELVRLAEQVALEEKIPVRKGVYASVQGPNLETGAEYRFLRIIGADVVGMSTVPEVIVARHMGLRVVGISVVTDMGLPDALKPCSLKEIIETANRAEPNLTRLIKSLIAKLPS
jgi:purine-nucleoside phosphorylase